MKILRGTSLTLGKPNEKQRAKENADDGNPAPLGVGYSYHLYLTIYIVSCKISANKSATTYWRITPLSKYLATPSHL